jgi:hypothetical protein
MKLKTNQIIKLKSGSTKYKVKKVKGNKVFVESSSGIEGYFILDYFEFEVL